MRLAILINEINPLENVNSLFPNSHFNTVDLRNVQRSSSRFNKGVLSVILSEWDTLKNEASSLDRDADYYASFMNKRVLIPDAIKYFKSFQRGYCGFNRVIFRNLETGDIVYSDLENRYSASYQKKIVKRANWLAWKYRKASSVMLTLTLNPKLFGNDKIAMWLSIKKEFNRFMTLLRYHLKKKGIILGKDVPYLSTIEAMNGRSENDFIGKGNPHIHVVFIGATRLFDWHLIEKWWGLGFIRINRTYGNKKIRKPINYVMKYVTKTYSPTDEKNLLTQSLSWLFGSRSFQPSRNLMYPLSTPSSGMYEALFLLSADSTVSISGFENFYSSTVLSLGAG